MNKTQVYDSQVQMEKTVYPAPPMSVSYNNIRNKTSKQVKLHYFSRRLKCGSVLVKLD